MNNHPDASFKDFISNILKNNNINDNNIEKLTTEECMIEFTKAFTHKSIDNTHNYEYYEILGDSTANNIIVWYYHRRFPSLFLKSNKIGTMSGQAIMSRLKQMKVSQSSFSKYANELNFWKYIRHTEEYNTYKNKILEDVFEAFIGCLEYLIDKNFSEHIGYGVVYNIMKNIIDKVDINVSLEFEDIYDAKTKINIEKNKFLSIRKEINIVYDIVDLKKEMNNIEIKENRFKGKVKVYHQNNLLYENEKEEYGNKKDIVEQKLAKILYESGFLQKLAVDWGYDETRQLQKKQLKEEMKYVKEDEKDNIEEYKVGIIDNKNLNTDYVLKNYDKLFILSNDNLGKGKIYIENVSKIDNVVVIPTKMKDEEKNIFVHFKDEYFNYNLNKSIIPTLNKLNNKVNVYNKIIFPKLGLNIKTMLETAPQHYEYIRKSIIDIIENVEKNSSNRIII